MRAAAKDDNMCSVSSLPTSVLGFGVESGKHMAMSFFASGGILGVNDAIS